MKVQLLPQLTEWDRYELGTGVVTGKDLCCHSAIVMVDGEKWGEASDCDGRWIVMSNDEADDKDGEVGGCYPASCVESLGYAIGECVDGIEGEVEVVCDDPRWAQYLAELEARRADRRARPDYY